LIYLFEKYIHILMNNSKELFEKYFNAETSIDEEAALKDYFSQHWLPDELESYQPMFACFGEQKEERLSDASFDSRFKARVGKKHRSVLRRAIIWSTSAAACVAIAIGSIYYAERQSNYMIVNGVRVNDPEKALMVAAEKLHLVTGSFNNSLSHVQQISRIGKHLSVISVFSHNNAVLPDSLQTKPNDEHEN
jgi:hypothetical protein